MVVKTDSVKAQNKVGLPIGAPGIIFFSIIPPLGSREGEIKMTKRIINKTPADQKKKGNPECGGEGGGRGGREMQASVARRGYLRMAGVPVCSDEPENTNTCVKKKKKSFQQRSRLKEKKNKPTKTVCYFCRSQDALT